MTNIPIGISDCFNIGMSGNCNHKCSVLNKGECEYFYPQDFTKEELNYFYDNGYYEKIISTYLKLN
mgnify:CR=1 FL=1